MEKYISTAEEWVKQINFCLVEMEKEPLSEVEQKHLTDCHAYIVEQMEGYGDPSVDFMRLNPFRKWSDHEFYTDGRLECHAQESDRMASSFFMEDTSRQRWGFGVTFNPQTRELRGNSIWIERPVESKIKRTPSGW